MENIKNFLKTNQNLILTALIISILVGFSNLVFAQAPGDTIRSIGGKTHLPSYDAGNYNQSYESGASQITSIIYYLIDFLTYILGGIASLMIVISGVKLILSMNMVTEVRTKEKETLKIALIGLFIVIIANQAITLVIFGQEGEVYRSAADLTQAAQRGVGLVVGLTNMVQVAIPVIAVLFIIISGVRMITAMGDQAKVTKAKKTLTWSIIGLILAGLSEIIVFQVVFPNSGTTLSNPQAFNSLVITMTNFFSGFISIISVIMIIYAGYLYVISRGGELIGKAKKALTAAIIGLLIAMAAFGLVNTFIKVQPLTQATSTTQQSPTVPKA